MEEELTSNTGQKGNEGFRFKDKGMEKEVKGHLQNRVQCIVSEHLFIDKEIHGDLRDQILQELRILF